MADDDLDIFIGGGGDDLGWLGLGGVADYARRWAAQSRRAVLYVPNARLRRVRRAVAAAASRGAAVRLIGHSWGGPDAWRAAAWAAAQGRLVLALITLDPVSGPLRRSFAGPIGCPWLNVVAAPSQPDRSDRLTHFRGLSRKPPDLPVAAASRQVTLDLNHWNVADMMVRSDAWRWAEAAAAR